MHMVSKCVHMVRKCMHMVSKCMRMVRKCMHMVGDRHSDGNRDRESTVGLGNCDCMRTSMGSGMAVMIRVGGWGGWDRG